VKRPTKRQTEVLRFVHHFTERHGYAPSIREIGKAMGIGSTHGVSDEGRAYLGTPGTVEISTEDLWRCTVCRLRYALPRASYEVSDTATWVAAQWRHFNEQQRNVILRDLREHLDTTEQLELTNDEIAAFGDLDAQTWRRLLGKLEGSAA
jgi:hypothetical protein